MIIGCGSAKLDRPAAAKDIYTGSLFRAARRHAETSGKPWRILSAEYGIIDPDEVIAPYDRRIESRSPPGWVKDPSAATGQGEHVYWWHALKCSVTAMLHPNCPEFLLATDRGAGVTWEVHAGRGYVEAWEWAVRQCDAPCGFRSERGLTFAVEAPLAGLQLGQRLQWYSRRHGENSAQIGLFG